LVSQPALEAGMRMSTCERVEQSIQDGLRFTLDPEMVKVHRSRRGLKEFIFAHYPEASLQVPDIIVRHKNPSKLVKAARQTIVEALKAL